jgi:dimethylargininase
MLQAHGQVRYGPRLVGHPTGTLRAAIVVAPSPQIEDLAPLQGEPNSVYKRAAEQHAVLVTTLRYFGVDVTVLDPPDCAPLGCAAADLAVCFEHGAVIMRPSALDRRAEVARIETECARLDIPIGAHIAAPGLLDGSDVLLAGQTAFIARTKRSNALARAGFAEIARANGYTPIEVTIEASAPSLRGVANAVASDTIVVAANRVDATAFTGFKLIRLELGQELGAGVLALGERRVIVDLRYRATAETLHNHGVAVEAIDLYDFGKVGLGPANLVLATKRS